MTTDKFALVITSAVHAIAPYTFLTDAGEREKQYIDSIIFFIEHGPVRKIIVCDNSGYTYPKSLQDLAQIHQKELELLSFKGSSDLVSAYGKGYGEGEILEFILSNSVLMAQAEGFLKVTGRLKLVNISELLQKINFSENYFMPISLLRPHFMMPEAVRRCVDVRVYYTTKDFFKQHLLFAYKNVRDENTFFLEHAYHKALENGSGKVRRFPVPPEIVGMSGSNGWMFKKRTWLQKAFIRVAFFLGYVQPIYRQKLHKAKNE